MKNVSNFMFASREFVVPVGLLSGCVGLLQWHSIEFWTSHVDPAIGWAWSVLLEAVGLWLWYRSGWTRKCLAGAASVLLLVGPLYVVAEPVVEQLIQARDSREIARKTAIARAQASEEKAMALAASRAEKQRARDRAIPVLAREIAELEKQLQVFLGNSEERSGWLPAIEKTQADLAERRRVLTDLYLAEAKAGPVEIEEPEALSILPVSSNPVTELGAIAIIVMQCLALILYQVTGVLAIRRLSQLATPKVENEPESNRVVEQPPESLTATIPAVVKKRPQLVMYG